jgi:hypothetical protein
MKGQERREENKSNRYIIRDVARKGGAKWFKPVYITKAEGHKGGLVGKVL